MLPFLFPIVLALPFTTVTGCVCRFFQLITNKRWRIFHILPFFLGKVYLGRVCHFLHEKQRIF
jgi:hypothetical protein